MSQLLAFYLTHRPTDRASLRTVADLLPRQCPAPSAALLAGLRAYGEDETADQLEAQAACAAGVLAEVRALLA